MCAEHCRGHEVLTAEGGPETRILVVERHSLGIFFFVLRAELRAREHSLPPRDLSAIKIREQAVRVGRLVIELNGPLARFNRFVYRFRLSPLVLAYLVNVREISLNSRHIGIRPRII